MTGRDPTWNALTWKLRSRGLGHWSILLFIDGRVTLREFFE